MAYRFCCNFVDVTQPQRLSPLVSAPLCLPVITLITEPSRSLQIIYIDKIHPLALQLPPYPIPRTDRPARLIPISQHYAF